MEAKYILYVIRFLKKILLPPISHLQYTIFSVYNVGNVFIVMLMEY